MSAGAGHVEIAPVRLKTCATCKETKPTTEFYFDKQTKDRLNCYCKPCARQKARRAFYRHHEAMLAKKAARRAEPTWREKARRNEDLYKARHPERKRAHALLNQAIKRGEMRRGSCEACGVPDAHAHHDDYSKPLEVHWMCHRCHSKEHRRTPEGLAATAAGK